MFHRNRKMVEGTVGQAILNGVKVRLHAA